MLNHASKKDRKQASNYEIVRKIRHSELKQGNCKNTSCYEKNKASEQSV